jgi:hypothetical protein
MKFFVSYATKDEKWAKWVVWELTNAKQRYRSIAQFQDFAPGMNFIERMRKAAEAESTLALFSPHYFQSDYCQQELDAALTGARNRLLPVRIAPCDPGAFLQNRIHIDLVDKSNDEAREALLSGVEAYVSQTLKAKEEHGFRQRPIFPGTPSAQEPPSVKVPKQEIGHPLKVLFLAPEVGGGVAPRRQLREMQNGTVQVRNAAAIRFKGVFHVHVNTLFEELNRESPHVFHFSGKQSGGDILMRTEAGTLTTVSDTALAGMFQSLDQGLRLVIIDTCY